MKILAFNRQVTQERNVALRARLKALLAEEAKLFEKKRELDRERERRLRVLRDTETFDTRPGSNCLS
jgi:uncharacterized protein YydD (DUF2326 family)